MPGHPIRGQPELGDDIRRDLVFDEGDAVAQLQLALLQPLQPRELGFEFALIFVGHAVR